MRIRFVREIRLLVKIDCLSDGDSLTQQEWEFDAGEVMEVSDVIWSEPIKYKTGSKKAKPVRFADIMLNQGSPKSPDHIPLVPEGVFEVLD